MARVPCCQVVQVVCRYGRGDSSTYRYVAFILALGYPSLDINELT